VPLHRHCATGIRRRQVERREWLRERAGRVLEALPRVHWVDVADPEFLRRVHPDLATFAREHDPREHGSALLLGPSGCGKTLAIVGLAHRLVAAARASFTEAEIQWIAAAHWTTAHALIRARRETPLGRGEAPAIERAMESTLLLLDELGCEPASEVIFEIADQRYSRRLPTIVTSGRTLAAFAGRYGDALVRRLAESGVGRLLDVYPEDA
jgi:DNA replication protein DnaC